MKRALYLGFLLILVIAVPLSITIAKSKKSDGGWLGVYLESVNYDLSDDMDLPVSYGAYIADIIDDSPAQEAGLKAGDVIIAYNGKKVGDADDLTDFVLEGNKGDKVKLTVIRNGKEKEIEVTLGKKAESAAWSFDVPSMKIFDDERHRSPGLLKSYKGGNGYIGVYLAGLSEQLGEYFGVEKGKGVLISEVVGDSPAEKAGLKAGDVVIGADGDAVDNSDDFQKIIGGFDEGDKVEIEIIRDKKKQKITVEVAKQKDHNFYGFWGDDDDRHIVLSPRSKICLDEIDFDDLNLHDLKDFKWENNFRFRLDDDDLNDIYFEIDEFDEEDLEDLKEELEELKEELKELHLKKEDIKGIKEELKELLRKLDE